MAFGQDPVEDPVARFGDREGLGQQLLGVDDLDATVTQRRGEGVVFALRLFDPDHFVEEKVGSVVRRQPGVFDTRPVHQHPPEPAYFGRCVQCHR